MGYALGNLQLPIFSLSSCHSHWAGGALIDPKKIVWIKNSMQNELQAHFNNPSAQFCYNTFQHRVQGFLTWCFYMTVRIITEHFRWAEISVSAKAPSCSFSLESLTWCRMSILVLITRQTVCFRSFDWVCFFFFLFYITSGLMWFKHDKLFQHFFFSISNRSTVKHIIPAPNVKTFINNQVVCFAIETMQYIHMLYICDRLGS